MVLSYGGNAKVLFIYYTLLFFVLNHLYYYLCQNKLVILETDISILFLNFHVLEYRVLHSKGFFYSLVLR